MTPKEKAEDLFSTYRYTLSIPNAPLGKHKDEVAKNCALIAVNQILEFMRIDDEYTQTASNANSKWVSYWLEVAREIEKL
jgi:cytoplasmic iron level regulating protein YaaA (DUF328/UPF0246 family)